MENYIYEFFSKYAILWFDICWWKMRYLKTYNKHIFFFSFCIWLGEKKNIVEKNFVSKKLFYRAHLVFLTVSTHNRCFRKKIDVFWKQITCSWKHIFFFSFCSWLGEKKNPVEKKLNLKKLFYRRHWFLFSTFSNKKIDVFEKKIDLFSEKHGITFLENIECCRQNLLFGEKSGQGGE